MTYVNYECPRCSSTEFAIDQFEQDGIIVLDVMCRNCGGFQGELNVNGNTFRLVA